jgi:small-conductance mechanosensitive channel
VRSDNIEKAVERVRQRDEGWRPQRIEVDTLTESQKLIESLRPRLDEVLTITTSLAGAGKGAPAGGVHRSRQRARLSALAAQLDGAIKAAELFEVRGRQQIARIQEYRRDVFTRDLFRRTRSPLRLTTWYQVTDEVPRIGYQLSTLWGYWWRDAQAQLPLLALLAAAVIAIYAGLDLAARRMFARRLAPVSDPLPSFFARAPCATWVAALRAAPAIAATLALYLGLMFLGLLDYQISPTPRRSRWRS